MERFFNLLSKAIKHELITGSFYVFLGFITSSFLSFLLNLFLARNLSYGDYGSYSSLLSIYNLATIPVGSLGITIVRFAGTYFANAELDKLASFYKKTLIFWFAVSLLIFIIYFLAVPLLSSFLKMENSLSLLIIGLAISASYLGISNSSFLQAMTRFKSISIILGSGAIVRLITGIILVSSGLKLFGSTLSIFVSPAFSFIVGIIPLRFLLGHSSRSKVQLHTKEIIKYGLPVSLAVFFLSSYISSDVLLVKHFFPEEQAGYYGGLSLIGKVIFYFTAPIPTVMFPLIIKREARGESTKNLLYLSILLILIPSIAISAFYFIYPRFSISFFLGGGEYFRIANYLGFFGIFLTLFSINNILVNFFLSLKKTLVVYLVAFGAALQIILIFFFHRNFGSVISSGIISSIFLLVALLLYYMKEYGFHNTSEQR